MTCQREYYRYMSIHEQFEGMVEREVHPEMRPELNRFLVTHAMVSEEAILELESFFRRNHIVMDNELSGATWSAEQYGRVFDGQ